MNPSTPPSPEQPQVTPDQLIGTGTQEQALRPAAPEVAAAPPAATPAAAATPVPAALTADEVAAAIAATPTVGTASPANDPAPAAAADQDVIEPEWVDKAERVIEQNSGNPFAEEEAVENLQVDYLQKRYGHSVKKSDDNNPAA